jgi:type IV pilus assembly protein PilC
MRELVLNIEVDIEGGTNLTEALHKHPLYFDDLFCFLAQAGEQSGSLEALLDRVATKRRPRRSKARSKRRFSIRPRPSWSSCRLSCCSS